MQHFAPLQAARPFTRFFLFMALLFMCLGFGAVLGSMAAKAAYGFIMEPGIDLLAAAQASPEALNAIKLIQFIAQLIGFILPAIFYARLVNVDVGEELALYNKALPGSYLIVVLFMVAILPLINLAYWLNIQLDFSAVFGEVGDLMKQQEEQNGTLTRLFLQVNNTGELLVALVIMAVMPAVGEELVFRGVFQKIFVKSFNSKHLGVWAAAIIFSASHFQFYGFLPRLVLGAALGYMFLYSRTIWVPILGHFVNNALAVLASYWGLDKSEGALNTDSMGTDASQWWIVALSLLITGGLLYFFKKSEQKRDYLFVEKVGGTDSHPTI